MMQGSKYAKSGRLTLMIRTTVVWTLIINGLKIGSTEDNRYRHSRESGNPENNRKATGSPIKPFGDDG
jgi:hypothetical protein